MKTNSLIVLAIICGSSLAAPPEPQFRLVLQAPPAASVNSVAVSPDGSLVATAAGEGGVRLYDAATGQFRRVVGGGGDRCVVFSPDGKTMTAAGFHMDKLAALWDVESGKRLQNFAGHTEWEVDATAISPDGKLLASTGVDKQILVWEIATGNLRHQLKDQPFRSPAIAFSPDSSTLATGDGGKAVKLWDVTTGKLRRSLEGHGDWICTLAFSPDGKLIASGSCDWGFHRGHDWPRADWRGAEKCEWKVWDAHAGKPLRTVTGTGKLLSLAFAPGGESLACGIGTDVQLYDLSPASDGRIVTSHDAEVTSVAFTPDGSAIISASHDQTVKRTDLAGNLQWQAPGYFEQVNSVALSDDGSLLLTGSSDHRFAGEHLRAGAKEIGPGAVRLWDIRSGRMLRCLGERSEQIMAVAVSADGAFIVAGGAAADGRGIVRTYSGATGAPLCEVNDEGLEVLSVAFSHDNKMVATGAADGIARIRDPQTGQILHTLRGHNGGATAVTFSHDDKVLFCGEASGSTRVWEVATGRPLRALKAESKAELFTVDRRMSSLGISRDGKTLATCGSSVNNEYVDSVKLWDADTSKLVRDFAVEKIHGRPMALSPDGSIIATGGKSVRLWDASTGKLLRELTGHLKRTQSIAFSADGRLIVAGGSYGTTNAWEVATGRHLVTLFAFTEIRNGVAADDWFAYTPKGYYHGSPGAERYLAWRVGDEFVTPATLAAQLHRPDQVESALRISGH